MSLAEAVAAYRLKRTNEFNRTRKQYRRSFLNFPFGISYDDKMSACTKIIHALNNEEVDFTDKDMAALEDGELGRLVVKNASEWPESYRRKRIIQFIAELEEYKKQRTREFKSLGRPCNSFVFNIDFGSPYDKKMLTCNMIIARLNGENVEITDEMLSALSNGRLETIIKRYQFLMPQVLNVERAAEPERLYQAGSPPL